jgi:hypothetical protein
MAPATRFLSRLIGLYCLLVSLSMAVHKEATVETVTALVHNPPLLFVVGVMAMGLGLAMTLGHNVWSGGALPVAVTLIGWVALAKGLLILFLPPEAAVGFFLDGLRYRQLFYAYAAFTFLDGVFLTFGRSGRH